MRNVYLSTCTDFNEIKKNQSSKLNLYKKIDKFRKFHFKFTNRIK